MRSFAVVPAAGRSRRMGRAKLLLPWGDSTVVDTVLSAWRSSRIERVVVTVARGDDELAEHCASAGADVVLADAPPPEMKDSVRLALEHFRETNDPDDDDAWLLAPADCVGLGAGAIDLVLDEYGKTLAEAGSASIVVPSVGGRRGHPVAFPWRLAKEVGGLGSDEGVNVLCRRHPIREFDVAGTLGDRASQILNDLDTPEQYRRLRPPPSGD